MFDVQAGWKNLFIKLYLLAILCKSDIYIKGYETFVENTFVEGTLVEWNIGRMEYWSNGTLVEWNIDRMEHWTNGILVERNIG